MKVSLLIILYTFMTNGTVFRDTWQNLNYLFQKVICEQHHHDNYHGSLEKNRTAFGLRMKKRPAIKRTSNNFYTAWNSVLYNTEKRLVELILGEIEKAVNIL